jgi:hypothetical protein
MKGTAEPNGVTLTPTAGTKVVVAEVERRRLERELARDQEEAESEGDSLDEVFYGDVDSEHGSDVDSVDTGVESAVSAASSAESAFLPEQDDDASGRQPTAPQSAWKPTYISNHAALASSTTTATSTSATALVGLVAALAGLG